MRMDKNILEKRAKCKVRQKYLTFDSLQINDRFRYDSKRYYFTVIDFR